ncbi:MAG: DPP IV N-terminal domain-containing protein [Myxococcaceae bacterium]
MKALIMTLLAANTPIDTKFLRDFAETRRFMAGRPVSAKPTPDGKVLFLRSGARDNVQLLFELDIATAQTRQLLSPEDVLKGAQAQLSVAERAQLERMRITARGFTSFQLSEDGKHILTGVSGKLYVIERSSGKVTALKTGDGAAMDPRFSADGSLVAYVRANDVHYVDLKTNSEHKVTTGGTELKPHGLAEFVAQEEMSRFSGYWLSPDSKKVAYQETDNTGVEELSIPDPMKPESKPEMFPYPRPGKPNAKVKLFLGALSGGKGTEVKWDSNAFPYLATVKWPKKGPLTLVVQNREQTKQQVLAADDHGATKVLLTEEDAAWINLDQAFPRWLEDGSGFLWWTERSGHSEVELRKADGSLDKVWVKGEAELENFCGLDEAAKVLYFNGGPNPTMLQPYRVALGGTPERLKLAEKPGIEMIEFNDRAKTLIDWATTFEQMPRTTVYKLNGQSLDKVAELPRVAEEPAIALNAQVHKYGSGEGFWGMVIRPHTFKPGQKLPVILQVYGGPGHQEVTAAMMSNLRLQWLADQGFIVVKLDGHGTPRRGRAWERTLKGNFASTADDQVAGLQAIAKEVPEMDMTRVGVTGWSFGGYLSALLGLSRGDVFKAAVVGAPVVDWKDYDTHYTERYLGVPPAADKAYEVSSLLTYVPKAERPLLVIHGTADDNVYFLHTLKLSDALFRAGKKHQVLPLANFTHLVPEPLVAERLDETVARYFQENL